MSEAHQSPFGSDGRPGQSGRSAPGEWPAIAALLSAALELPHEARAAFLDSACVMNPALRDEVAALLDASERPGAVDAPVAALGRRMTPERWQQIEALAQAARQRSGDRSAFLAQACAGDSILRGEVDALLGHMMATGSRPPSLAEGTERVPTPSLTGRQIGPYRLATLIDSGGMGAVYRARDTRLERDVAVKVLLRAAAGGDDHFARLEREARLLAALNHPNVAAIYGIEEVDARPALILELVEGETLAERIGRAPSMCVGEALAIARQIGLALEAAHEKGIVHRDLKPANVKVTREGTVKVLDFGLARLAAGAAAEAFASAAPLETREGVVLGTPAYMSPEQAQGVPVDRRTDVWAFGCVLYELLTGRAAFAGATFTETMAAVLTRDPDWSPLPAETPRSVRTLLRRCLEKDPRRRLRDIGDARWDLDEAENDAPGAPVRPAPRRWGWAAAGAAIAAALALAAALWGRSSPVAEPLRFAIDVEPNADDANIGGVILSPTGTHIAHQLNNGSRVSLVVRRLSDADSRILAQWQATTTEAAPFFSPDGDWIGYFAEGALRKVPLAGGPSVSLADAPAPRGGTWGEDGTIVYAPIARSGLWQVPAEGGTARALTTLDSSRGETSHRYPAFVPSLRTVLFMAQGSSFAEEAVGVVSLDNGARRIVVEQGGIPQVAKPGHLVYLVRGGTLMAVRLDETGMEIAGRPAAILEGVGAFSSSQAGALVYRSAGPPLRRRLVWVDRRGTVEPLPAAPRWYQNPRLSPDDRYIAVGIEDGPDRSIWTYDLRDDRLARLTSGGSNLWAAWSPDGTRVAYASNRPGTSWDLVWKAADGNGEEEVLFAGPEIQHPGSFAHDGTLAFTQIEASGWDVWLVRPGTGAEPGLLLGTGADERSPALSPDGQWIAYASNESGRSQIFVRPLAERSRWWQVSNDGGEEPVWARSGTELFFRDGPRLMSVELRSGAAFPFGKPRVLFEGEFESDTPGTQSYDVTGDGRRFLMTQRTSSPGGRWNVVVNWHTDLQRMMQP
jgi:serine/threonine-protein kinase